MENVDNYTSPQAQRLGKSKKSPVSQPDSHAGFCFCKQADPRLPKAFCDIKAVTIIQEVKK